FQRTTVAEWSMFFIGILALGAALSGLTDVPTYRLLGFWIGAPVTTVTWAIQLSRFSGTPRFTWGLPLVGPMISASVAGWLARDYGQMYHVMGAAFFVMSLLTAGHRQHGWPPGCAGQWLDVAGRGRSGDPLPAPCALDGLLEPL